MSKSNDAWDLIFSLVKPFVEKRSRVELGRFVQVEMNLFLGILPSTRQNECETSEATSSSSSQQFDMKETGRRCHICLYHNVSKKAKYEKLYQIFKQCQLCGEAVCHKHSILVCKSGKHKIENI